jgi:SAM-dependent methyltransferase
MTHGVPNSKTVHMDETLGLPQGAFARIDEGDDDEFYEPARLVLHIDDHAVAVLTRLYREILPAGGVLLDLMSSWVSHLPKDVDYAEVIGHGMNAEELAANPRLSRHFVQNLNRDAVLPLPDASVDAAMICVAVQYLTQPVAVLREAARVLRPGGLVVISFSNRCFWTKAVAVWRGLDDAGHARLVELCLNTAGFEKVETRRLCPWIEDEQDPLYAVIGRKPAIP